MLVVEDDHDISEAVRGVLEEAGHEVRGAENGRAALLHLQEEPAAELPDLIMLDLRMPVMDGWEFRALQKNDPELKAIPIIACSADPSPQAVAISADAYLTKPLDSNQLVTTVERLLHQLELNHLSQRLESAERLASLGRLAAGVGHEINNPLAFAMLNLSMSLKKLAPLGGEAAASSGPSGGARVGASRVEDGVVTDIIGMLTESEMGLERIRQTVERLQKLSRNAQRRHEPFDLDVIIDQSIAMAWTQIQHRARLSKDYRKVGSVTGDPVALGQVFLNLLVNAAQAIPDGDAQNNEIAVSTDMVEGELVVEIRDTGSGIASEDLPHIFEPFFTTKPLGVGTGLGLSISRQTVADHAGRIEFDSAPGRGTTVRVFLAAAGATTSPRRPQIRPAAVAAPASVPAHRGRMLVIDDEPLIGRVIRSALADEHDVFTELRAADALARFEAGETFDLILCDLAMPNIGGAELFAILSARWPVLAARLVFMTGGAFTSSTQAFLDNTTAPVLAKPFSVDEVRRVAREHAQAALLSTGLSRGSAPGPHASSPKPG